MYNEVVYMFFLVRPKERIIFVLVNRIFGDHMYISGWNRLIHVLLYLDSFSHTLRLIHECELANR